MKVAIQAEATRRAVNKAAEIYECLNMDRKSMLGTDQDIETAVIEAAMGEALDMLETFLPADRPAPDDHVHYYTDVYAIRYIPNATQTGFMPPLVQHIGKTQ